MIYGYELASTSDGRSLVDVLSELCECDVAASDDRTGHANLGGDWELEYTTGQIDHQVAFESAARQALHYVLDSVAPEVTSIDTADLGGDGFIDAIHIQFSEAILDSTVIANADGRRNIHSKNHGVRDRSPNGMLSQRRTDTRLRRIVELGDFT